MACNSNQNVLFGVHSATIYNLSNGLPYENGFLEIMGDVTYSGTVENVPLHGGSNAAPFDVGNGIISSELTFKVKQFEPAMFQEIGGAILTETAASATGTITTALNVKGATTIEATTGIASVTITSGDEADLKEGAYAIVAASTSTVDVYAYTNVDFERGTDVNYTDADKQIIAAGVTVTSGATTALADFGLTITGGSGTIALVVGDSAVFRVAPPHGVMYDYSFGENGQYPNYVGIAFYSGGQADGTSSEWLFSRVKANGLDLAMMEKNWSEVDITAVATRNTNIFTGDCNIYNFRQRTGE